MFGGRFPYHHPRPHRHTDHGTPAAKGHNLGLCACAAPILLQPFNGLFSRTTWVSRYQQGKTNLDFTGARDSEWQWHQLGRMQVCTSLQTDNHANTPPLVFLQAGCPSCRPTNSVKALNALSYSVSKLCWNVVARRLDWLQCNMQHNEQQLTQYSL